MPQTELTPFAMLQKGHKAMQGDIPSHAEALLFPILGHLHKSVRVTTVKELLARLTETACYNGKAS